MTLVGVVTEWLCACKPGQSRRQSTTMHVHCMLVNHYRGGYSSTMDACKGSLTVCSFQPWPSGPSHIDSPFTKSRANTSQLCSADCRHGTDCVHHARKQLPTAALNAYSTSNTQPWKRCSARPHHCTPSSAVRYLRGVYEGKQTSSEDPESCTCNTLLLGGLEGWWTALAA